MEETVVEKNAPNESKTVKKKNASIELLRVISMFAIVFGHMMQFGVLRGYAPLFSVNYFVLNFLDAFTVFAVNVYALISGYLMFNKRRRLSRILELWLEVVLFGVISIVIGRILGITYEGKEGISGIIKTFIPFLTGQYWYFTAYVALALFMPAFNAIVDKFNFKQSKVLFFFIVAFAFFAEAGTYLDNDILGVNIGISFVWISCMYIVGAIIKKHGFGVVLLGKERNNGFYILTFCLSCTLMFLSKVIIAFVTNKVLGHTYADGFFTYKCSAIAIMSAISLFKYILGLKTCEDDKSFCSKTALLIGPCTFGIYVVHGTDLVCHYAYGFCNNYADANVFAQVGISLAVAVAVFVLGFVLEYIRIKLFKLLKIDKFCALVTEKISNIFAKIIKIK